MGNTVGDSSAGFCKFFADPSHAYILGLWCADGYHRTSSIGLSNVNENLIQKFADFLKTLLPADRLKLKVYLNRNIVAKTVSFGILDIKNFYSAKAKQPAYHVYVNSRPLLSEFKLAKLSNKDFDSIQATYAYLAGRFDGDGTIGKDMRRDLRISYTTKLEAEADKELLEKLGFRLCKVYYYKTSVAYVLYVSRFEAEKFIEKILLYSLRLQNSAFESRRDLIAIKSQQSDANLA